METHKKKCSFKNHNEIEANSYCTICKIYMCNKCENHHSNLFLNHQLINVDKDLNNIFTGYCQEEEHQMKLEYFCKTHNILCCAGCIAKLKTKNNGKHSDCIVCLIEDIEEEKKSKLNDNIKNLEELSNTIHKSINNLKITVNE